MKALVAALALVPTLSFASIYSCSGAGFSLELTGSPVEMKVVGNGFNTVAQNVKINTNFNTIFTGNTTSPAATLRLTINDGTFGNPGDSFGASLQVSSANGVREYNGLTCVRGNE